jgi:hypothetical protein
VSVPTGAVCVQPFSPFSASLSKSTSVAEPVLHCPGAGCVRNEDTALVAGPQSFVAVTRQ